MEALLPLNFKSFLFPQFMIPRFLSVIFLLINMVVFSQEDASMKKYAGLVKPDELKDNLTILASDALEGRYTGSRGQKMAAAFIANHFREVGLVAPINGSYYQPIQLYSVAPGDSYLSVGTTRYENFSGMLYMGNEETGAEIKTQIVHKNQQK